MSYMDSLIVSCKDNFVVTKFACYLANIYGPKTTMHTGNRKKKVEVPIFDYLDKMI